MKSLKSILLLSALMLTIFNFNAIAQAGGDNPVVGSLPITGLNSITPEKVVACNSGRTYKTKVKFAKTDISPVADCDEADSVLQARVTANLGSLTVVEGPAFNCPTENCLDGGCDLVVTDVRGFSSSYDASSSTCTVDPLADNAIIVYWKCTNCSIIVIIIEPVDDPCCGGIDPIGGKLADPQMQDGDLTVAPNPANELIRVSFDLTETYENMQMDIYAVSGQLIHSESLGLQTSGNISRQINVNDLESGLYIVRLTSGGMPLADQRFQLIH